MRRGLLLYKAKEIVSALAEGIDPITGELLPEDSVYNKGEIVCALYAVLAKCDEKEKIEKAAKYPYFAAFVCG